MSKMVQNRELKKQAILSAAKTLFLTEGFVATNMDKVAKLAEVTKQTLYRYYASKESLFEATLIQIGHDNHADFSKYLDQKVTDKALHQFAKYFVYFHLSSEHIRTLRLLISESSQAQQAVARFFEIGIDETEERLNVFFSSKLAISEPTTLIALWLGMLLAPRTPMLLGAKPMTKKQMDTHAKAATDFLIHALPGYLPKQP